MVGEAINEIVHVGHCPGARGKGEVRGGGRDMGGERKRDVYMYPQGGDAAMKLVK